MPPMLMTQMYKLHLTLILIFPFLLTQGFSKTTLGTKSVKGRTLPLMLVALYCTGHLERITSVCLGGDDHDIATLFLYGCYKIA